MTQRHPAPFRWRQRHEFSIDVFEHGTMITKIVMARPLEPTIRNPDAIDGSQQCPDLSPAGDQVIPGFRSRHRLPGSLGRTTSAWSSREPDHCAGCHAIPRQGDPNRNARASAVGLTTAKNYKTPSPQVCAPESRPTRKRQKNSNGLDQARIPGTREVRMSEATGRSSRPWPNSISTTSWSSSRHADTGATDSKTLQTSR